MSTLAPLVVMKSSATLLLWALSACASPPDQPHTGTERHTGRPAPTDLDGDGVSDDLDCADDDATVHPGATERCDGFDQDCDGDIDEGVRTRFWLDLDRDGYGQDGAAQDQCTAPPEYAPQGGDCDDANDAVHPGAEERCNGGVDDDCDGDSDEQTAVDAGDWYADRDLDTFGDPLDTFHGCPAEGYVDVSGDCDDLEESVHPGAPEVCNGSIDDDCDPSTDEDLVSGSPWHPDRDGDRFGDAGVVVLACEQPADTVVNALDCDDGSSSVNPLAIEHCDGVDEDCDRAVDEDSIDRTAWYRDVDGDGFGNVGDVVQDCAAAPGRVADGTDCNDLAATTHPGAAERCDIEWDVAAWQGWDIGADNDCDPTTQGCAACDVPAWLEVPSSAHPRADVSLVASTQIHAGPGDEFQTEWGGAVVLGGGPSARLALKRESLPFGGTFDSSIWIFDMPLAPYETTAAADSTITPYVWCVGGIHGAELTGADPVDLLVTGYNVDCPVLASVPPGEWEDQEVTTTYLRNSAPGPEDNVSIGDWDGDGAADLALDYHTCTAECDQRGIAHGGMVFGLGPLLPGVTDPFAQPEAIYEVTALDVLDRSQGGSGSHSTMVHDFDGDGAQDVLMTGEYWGDIAPGPHGAFKGSNGGLALFPGGMLGTHGLGEELAIFYGVCDPDVLLPSAVGDLNGDGLSDVTVLGHKPSYDGGRSVRTTVFVLTSLGQLRGLHSLTEASSAIIVGHPGSGMATTSITIPDLDGNGSDELVVGEWPTESVYVFMGPVQGVMDIDAADLEIVGPGSGSGDFADTFTSGDLDGDGLHDLVLLDDEDTWVVSGRTILDSLVP